MNLSSASALGLGPLLLLVVVGGFLLTKGLAAFPGVGLLLLELNRLEHQESRRVLGYIHVRRASLSWEILSTLFFTQF